MIIEKFESALPEKTSANCNSLLELKIVFKNRAKAALSGTGTGTWASSL
jgi:hypothetical protein